MGCRKCPSLLKAYVGFEKSAKREREGAVWYADLPEYFECECGRTQVTLRYLRESMPALLEISVPVVGTEVETLYNQEVLDRIAREFSALLAARPGEEAVQVFLEEHPVLFHQFSPIKVFHKPAILSFFKADFGLLTPKRELFLVEIERLGKRLVTKAGIHTAEFQQALSQVNSWLEKAEHHRAAVLDGLGLKNDDVVAIKGVLIIGRDRDLGTQLRHFKWTDYGRVSVFTYDDLIAGVSALSRIIGKSEKVATITEGSVR